MHDFKLIKLAFEIAGYSIVKTTKNTKEKSEICTSELSEEKFDLIQKGRTTNTLTKSEIIELARKIIGYRNIFEMVFMISLNY